METDMPSMASIDNPLAKFRNGAAASVDGREWPIPLTATRIDVTIRGGLAIVVTERSFRNGEPRAIEATLTFPVPVDATLCALSARIDGRVLNAVAQPRSGARKTYEDAIDQGHAAVLHEELIKGVHMLSVGQIQPGAEIAVTATWTAPLSFVGDTPRLRIPTTIGEIFGQSPLAASDDLVTADVKHVASVSIACEDGVATLLGAGSTTDGRYSVTLDHPIDVAVSGFVAHTLHGVAADGRAVELTIEPLPQSTEPLAIDVLFDHSGSMAERASSNFEMLGSKFEVAKAGLIALARSQIKSGDRLRLWEFNDNVAELGEAAGGRVPALVEKLNEATGGTEIGRAFDAVTAKSKTRNVVIITDGKSWAFDPQRLARSGLRVTAVLIGEDALEGGVADLAGMTGGQVFVAAGSDIATAIAAAFDAARAPHRVASPIEGVPSKVGVLRRGGRVTASWGGPAVGNATPDARLIGATAAMLAIPLMPQGAAAELAAREGIVCHLTSLVLVDEAGTRHEGVPATRKVALSTPRTSDAGAVFACLAPASARHAVMADYEEMPRGRSDRAMVSSGRLLSRRAASAAPKPTVNRPQINLGRVLARIDWDADPEALRRGDLHLLQPDVTALIWEAARLATIDALAWATGLDPAVAVIALMAKAAAKGNRAADRLARSLLHNADATKVAAAMEELGLQSLSLAP
jgi:Vault protein inter-alpha-trypsin domain